MPRFKVDFVSSDGRAGTCELDAASERNVVSLLETRGQTAVRVRAAAASERPVARQRVRGGRAMRRALLDFTHQMTAVMESGIPVLSGLRAVLEQTSHPALRAALRRVADRIEGGQTLAESLAAEPAVFPTIYARTVAAGEASGTLAEVFGKLAAYLEDTAETRAAVMSALTYPALVVGALALATVAMLVFVIPRFAEMFDRFNADLPVPTRFLMSVSSLLRERWPGVLTGLAVLAVGARFALRDARVRRWVDDRALCLPVFGPLLVGAYMHRLVELLNLLTRAALPIVQTLRVTSDSIGNEALRQDVRAMMRAVEGGRTLAEALGDTRWMTPLVRRMLAVGEQAGRSDQIFDYLARYYARQTRRTVKTLSTLIEPALIVGLAAVILCFALAIFLPMLRVLRLVGSA